MQTASTRRVAMCACLLMLSMLLTACGIRMPPAPSTTERAPPPAALYAGGCPLPGRAGSSVGYLVESYLPALIAQARDCDRRMQAIAAWADRGASGTQ